MSVESLRRCRDKKIHIVSAFQRLLPDSAIESLYAYGISEIAQAFWMAQELERVYQNEQARPGLGRTSILPLHLEGSEEMEGYTDGSLVDIPLSQFTGFGVLFRSAKSTSTQRPEAPMTQLVDGGAARVGLDLRKVHVGQGIPGNLHNAEADRLVGSAHGNEQLAWSLNLEASRTVPFWERWNGQPAPGKPGSLIKKIECAEVDEHLLAQVRVANPQEQIEQGDVKDTMAVSIWFLAGKGKFHAKNLPEMQHCPRDHTDEAPEEMREHLLECTIGDLELSAPQMGSIVAAWTNEYV
ncbi:hypothetical protein EV179_006465, partial [Coemansia sp. RSA 487]